MHSLPATLACLGLAALLAGCGDGNDNDGTDGAPTPTRTATASPQPSATLSPTPASTPVTAAAVIENYADLLFANYSDSVAAAEHLRDAIDAFVAAPTQASFEAAKQAWIDGRPSYQQSEVGRFYDGPIDNPDDGPEGRINAWPLDESFIDYVEGDPSSGIINDPAAHPEISAATLRDLNEQGGETNISTGWHGIEFLLWGQDRNASGPGQRPFTDYVTDGSGTADNQERRGDYLKAAADLLVDDLTFVRDAWAPGVAGNYRSEFTSVAPEEALRRILTGMATLSAAELTGERLSVAFETQDQEDEHSCFSDTTLTDLRFDEVGIQNVYFGRYGTLDGPGIDDLVRQADPALDASFRSELDAALASLDAIPRPFDQAILGADSAPGRQAIAGALDALDEQNGTIADVAERLGVSIGTL